MHCALATLGASSMFFGAHSLHHLLALALRSAERQSPLGQENAPLSCDIQWRKASKAYCVPKRQREQNDEVLRS